ncbi:hypothetical protein L6452_42359 [Arctium lappa]|uniref:Uncharacterized protein n=1 Tax=Arctium lappa TaxID=4217 RepID=A0ACB8XM40_ARCLA|nr:hypothetical protein L6452_42359 [Arctium lappa]
MECHTLLSQIVIDSHLPLVEFTYNNSYHSSIGMVPFEALYGRKYRTPVCWLEEGEKQFSGPEIVQEKVDKVKAEEERVIPLSEIRVDEGNRCIGEPNIILEKKTKKLRHKEVTTLKASARLQNHGQSRGTRWRLRLIARAACDATSLPRPRPRGSSSDLKSGFLPFFSHFSSWNSLMEILEGS